MKKYIVSFFAFIFVVALVVALKPAATYASCTGYFSCGTKVFTPRGTYGGCTSTETTSNEYCTSATSQSACSELNDPSNHCAGGCVLSGSCNWTAPTPTTKPSGSVCENSGWYCVDGPNKCLGTTDSTISCNNSISGGSLCCSNPGVREPVNQCEPAGYSCTSESFCRDNYGEPVNDLSCGKSPNGSYCCNFNQPIPTQSNNTGQNNSCESAANGNTCVETNDDCTQNYGSIQTLTCGDNPKGRVCCNYPTGNPPPPPGNSCSKVVDATYNQCGCNAGGVEIGIGSSTTVEKYHYEGSGCDSSPQYACMSSVACTNNICDVSSGRCPAPPSPSSPPNQPNTPTPTDKDKKTKPVLSCTVTYNVVPQNPKPNQKGVIIDVYNVKTPNRNCVALYLDGKGPQPGQITQSNNGYEFFVNGGKTGYHTAVLQFGVSSLYPGVDCGKQYTCNAKTFTTGDIRTTYPSPLPTKSPAVGGGTVKPIDQKKCGDQVCSKSADNFETYYSCPKDCPIPTSGGSGGGLPGGGPGTGSRSTGGGMKVYYPSITITGVRRASPTPSPTIKSTAISPSPTSSGIIIRK